MSVFDTLDRKDVCLAEHRVGVADETVRAERAEARLETRVLISAPPRLTPPLNPRLKTELGCDVDEKDAAPEGDSFGVVMSAFGTTHLLLTECLHCETQTVPPLCKVKCETENLT